MSKKMASLIIAHGLILAGLGLGLQSIAPELARTPLRIALGGGGLCVLWGLAALCGHQRRTGVLLTLAVMALTVLSPMLGAWMNSVGTINGRLLLTLMLALTLAMILYVMHGERPSEFYQMGPSGRDDLAAREKSARADENQRRSKSPR